MVAEGSRGEGGCHDSVPSDAFLRWVSRGSGNSISIVAFLEILKGLKLFETRCSAGLMLRGSGSSQ